MLESVKGRQFCHRVERSEAISERWAVSLKSMSRPSWAERGVAVKFIGVVGGCSLPVDIEKPMLLMSFSRGLRCKKRTKRFAAAAVEPDKSECGAALRP